MKIEKEKKITLWYILDKNERRNMRKLALSDEILLKIEKPARYIGNEVNSVMKDKNEVDIRFAMCFPDVYEIGMSHLGIQILYDMFNRREDVWCERVYSPWMDLDKIMREKKIPLFALESQDPIKQFDFLGITIQYEMCYTNILQVLDLSGIPLFASERNEEDPIVIGGGPCTYNPEPLADFFDIFYIGEGETVYLSGIPLFASERNEEDPIVIGGGPCTYNPEPLADFFDIFYIGEGETVYDELLDAYKEHKKIGSSRREFLERAAEIPGLYVPAFYDVTYHDDGTIASFEPNNVHAKPTIEKQMVLNVTDTYYPEKPVVPFIKVTQDRVVLEIQRGCIRGCRFCQAGMLYRPTRERALERLKEYAYKMLKSTGHEEISLSSLSSSDYSQLKGLVNFLIEEFKGKGINISLPSLRIDAFSLDVMSKVQDIKKSSLTFAPEAGSQRLRDVINKGLTEEIILEGAGQAFEGGWTRVKLYFMLGLPTETEEDMKEIAHLAEKVAERYYQIPKAGQAFEGGWTRVKLYFMLGLPTETEEDMKEIAHLAEKVAERYYQIPKDQRNGKCQIVASTSFFIPKPFTPFQWATMCNKEDYIQKAHIVNNEMKDDVQQGRLYPESTYCK